MSDLLTKDIYIFGNNIYLLSELKTWDEAQLEAERFQGNLVTINNSAEHTFLASSFVGQNLWIGYSDAEEEGTFKWVDGDTSSYENWRQGQPDNSRGDDFVILDSSGSWQDAQAFPIPSFQGIIEVKNPSTPIVVVEDLGIIEPYSGSTQASFKVKVVGSSDSPISVNYSTANDTGIAGINYAATSGTLVFNPGETEKTITVSVNHDDDTVSGETFFLNLSAPTNAILARNQAKATIRESTKAYTFGDSTYLLTNPNTWGKSQLEARSFSGNLVTINNAEEQTFLTGLFADKTPWIGYSDSGKEQEFEWVNGTSAYERFGRIDNNRGVEDFIALDIYGNWVDVNGSNIFPGIIEIPGALEIPVSDLTSRQIYTRGDSIYLLSNSGSWGDAQAEAQRFQGNLVTINDATEQTFLAGLFAGKTAWLGYSDAGEEGRYQWISGEDNTYENWANGQPDPFQPLRYHFAALDSIGNWYSLVGSTLSPGIIEIKNPEIPILVIDDLGIIEPANGSQKATFTVRRYGDSSSAATVNYSTADDTAVAGTHYVAKSGTLTFAPNETEKTIELTINADSDTISGEIVNLNLSNPNNAVLGNNQAKAIIRETTDAVTFGGHTYLLSNLGTWGEAQEQARTFGGNLVTINDAQEQAFLADTYSGQNLWIGYSDAGQEYDNGTKEGFRWVSGTTAYTNWLNGQPSGFTQYREDFVILSANGGWDDVEGSREFRGIIEIPNMLSTATPNPTPPPPETTPNPTPTPPSSTPPPNPTPITPPPTPVQGIKIIGNGLNNRFRGGEGNDVILGKKGNDRLDGLGGDDRLIGGAGKDRLRGGDGDDLLKGGKDNDKLWGNGGSDRLIGGKGKDKVVGGDGADIFTLSKGSGFDRIQDFKDGQDLIDLPKKLGFRDLTLEQKGRNLILRDGSDQLAILKGVRENQITRADFA